MAVIGKFKSAENGFQGTIETFLAVLDVRFERVSGGTDAVPDYRIYRGMAEIGAAWDQQTKAKRRYLAAVLDDPSLPRPIECRLVQAEDGWNLMWSRS